MIVDTCVWIEFFRGPESDVARALRGQLMERRVVMVRMVLAEILQGIRNVKEAQAVKEALGRLPCLEITREMWEKAGDLSASLRKRGKTIPLSDLVIAAAALSAGHEVFTVAPHFGEIEGMRLHAAP
ncbi:MAG: PIN domain-containing protein [Deltaproteobacteria bacterium]|nr:PIN domain-containing protein [Deltaproteobacteria bacterium]